MIEIVLIIPLADLCSRQDELLMDPDVYLLCDMMYWQS